jgi:crotonobetainyl-CoA:carnitine CoA-transferase CaiB-like acyl-CoA transferase
MQYVAPPTKFSGTPAAIRRPAPLHGQHTAEILAEAGYTNTEIDSLAARRIVVRQ